MQRFHLIFIISSIFLLFSCAKDKLDENGEICIEEITYQANARSIISTTCAYAGCHDGSSAPGNYNSFNGLSPFLSDSKFKLRAIDRRDMPPNYADGPTSLSQEELNIITCWIKGGYLE